MIVAPSSADLRWTLAPIPAPDPLVTSDEDLLVGALAEAESYRALAVVAIADRRELQRNHDRLRESRDRLLDEYRRLRESAMRPEAA